MISQLTIRNFKSFDEIILDLRNFTLLVGMNSVGKSSVIQSLLVAIQNITHDGRSPLNGGLVSLGEFTDARNFITNAKSFTVNIKSQSHEILFNFFEDNGLVKCKIKPERKNKLANYLHQKSKRVHYLSSKRIGSQDLYQKNYEKYNDYGILGEYAIDFFDKNKQNPIEDYFIIKASGIIHI